MTGSESGFIVTNDNMRVPNRENIFSFKILTTTLLLFDLVATVST